MVKVREMEESRKKTFASSDEEFHNFNNDSLRMKIDFQDEGFVSATKYKFEIIEAKDSTGKALKVKGFKSDEFRKIERQNMFFSSRKKDHNPNLLRLELTLDNTERTATSVDIQGNLLLKAGEQKAAFFKDVAKMVDKELAHDLLKKAGVTIIVGKKSKFGNSSNDQVRLEVSGKLDLVGDISLVNSKGESASNGSSRSGFGGKDNYSFYIDSKAKDDVFLKVMIATNQKEVKVPFKIIKQPLP